MALVKIKSGVKPRNLVILAAIANVAQELGNPPEVFITSGTEGRHMPGSKHYTGEALDVRSHNFPSFAAKREFLNAVRRRLGRNYDVILESLGRPNEHFHIEYDPK